MFVMICIAGLLLLCSALWWLRCWHVGFGLRVEFTCAVVKWLFV